MVGQGHFGECGNFETTLLSSFQDENSNIELDPVVSLALNHRLIALVLPGHKNAQKMHEFYLKKNRYSRCVEPRVSTLFRP